MKVIPSDARNQTSLISKGSKVTFGAIKHSVVAPIVVRAPYILMVKDTHCSASVLVHIGALVHPVYKPVPRACGQLSG